MRGCTPNAVKDAVGSRVIFDGYICEIIGVERRGGVCEITLKTRGGSLLKTHMTVRSLGVFISHSEEAQ